MKTFLGLLAALLLSTPVLAHSVAKGSIEIIHPNIPQPAAGAMAAAGYMGISNTGEHPDRLIGVETPAAQSAMLHQSMVDANGVASMAHVEALEIPAQDTVVLEPGGYHIMLMGLTQPLVEGQMVPAVLVFEQAGRIEMSFMVDPADGADHTTMEHSAMGHGPDGAAHGHGGTTVAMTGDDSADIIALLKAQFDTPETPLTVAPVTVQGQVAIAGWAQGDKGGRAFLRKEAQGWFVEHCAGSALMQTETLVGLGLALPEAESLLTATRAAESTIDPKSVELFDSFDGLLQIGKDGHAASE